MNLKLVTLLGVKIDQEIYELTIPTSEGEIAIYPDHEPLVALIVPGIAIIRREKNDSDDKLEHFAVSSGVVEVARGSIRVLTDVANRADEIIESEAKAALERAKKMREEAKDQIELARAHEMVDRHIVQLKVAELHRHHRRG